MISIDGIYRQKKRKKPNRKKQSAGSGLFTVSARVKEKKEDARRRLAAMVMVLVMLIGLGWAVKAGSERMGQVLFSENDKYLVQYWDLRSDGILTPAHIREIARFGDRENLFAINLQKARNDLESAANVRAAQVYRKLPDTLVVRVQERLAVARLGAESRAPSLAVDRDGYVLGPGALRSNLPSITGLRQAGLRPGVVVDDMLFRDALKFIELADRAHISTFVRIREINVADPEILEVRLMDGERILITRTYVENRVAELIPILQRYKEAGKVARLIKMTGEPGIPPAVEPPL